LKQGSDAHSLQHELLLESEAGLRDEVFIQVGREAQNNNIGDGHPQHAIKFSPTLPNGQKIILPDHEATQSSFLEYFTGDIKYRTIVPTLTPFYYSGKKQQQTVPMQLVSEREVLPA
jgi:hypothetical protein